MMERCVVFPGWLFPVLLLAPQLAVTFVFFFWPAGQAIAAIGAARRCLWSVDPFCRVGELRRRLRRCVLSRLGRGHPVFSPAVAVLALASGLLFAVMANQVVRGAALYKTVLLLPYAVAPAVAGVLWLFLFNPSVGIVAAALRRAGIDWNYLLERPASPAAGDPGRRVEAGQL